MEAATATVIGSSIGISTPANSVARLGFLATNKQDFVHFPIKVLPVSLIFGFMHEFCVGGECMPKLCKLLQLLTLYYYEVEGIIFLMIQFAVSCLRAISK